MDSDEEYRRLAAREAERKQNEYLYEEEKRVWAENKRNDELRKSRERQAQVERDRKAQKAALEKARKAEQRKGGDVRGKPRSDGSSSKAPQTSGNNTISLGTTVAFLGGAVSAYFASLQGITGYGLLIVGGIGALVSYWLRKLILWGFALAAIGCLIALFTGYIEI